MSSRRSFPPTPAVFVLLALNVAVFLAGSFLQGADDGIDAVGALWFPTNSNFGVWQLVTHMFLHGGPTHIFFNMFALFSFGRILEAEWGTARFLVFYFLCGLGAGLVQTGVNWQEFGSLHARLVGAGVAPSEIDSFLTTGSGLFPQDQAIRDMADNLYRIYQGRMVGASGAIYGLLVAFGFLHPNAKLAFMFVPVPIAAKYFIPGLLLLDLFSGVTGVSIFGASIAHYAHLGGAAIGFLLMLLWRRRNRRPPMMFTVGQGPAT